MRSTRPLPHKSPDNYARQALALRVVFVLIEDQQLTRSIKLQSSSAGLLVLNKRLSAKAIASCTELRLDQRNWPQARASTGQKRSPAVAFQNVVLTGKSLQCTCWWIIMRSTRPLPRKSPDSYVRQALALRVVFVLI